MLARNLLSGVFAIAVLLAAVPAGAQVEVTVAAQGAASNRPVPNGATANVLVSVRNAGKSPLTRVVITATFDGLTPATTEVWRTEGGSAVSVLERLPAGQRIERVLRLRVTNAPIERTKRSIAVEARTKDVAGKGETLIEVSDCVGAYRAKLEALRPTISQGVRDAAEKMRRIDPSLPVSRTFPLTGARSGELAAAERLAATVAARRGADGQMATEWFRYMIQRWSSELNAYTSQPANPGLCANNYYQIAGYRQGLQPITRHLDTIKNAANFSLKAAREAAKADESEDIASIVSRLAKDTTAQIDGKEDNTFALLAAARAAVGPRPASDVARPLSLAETAAWLGAADRRAQALTHEIEQLLAAIAAAHKESCSCAF